MNPLRISPADAGDFQRNAAGNVLAHFRGSAPVWVRAGFAPSRKRVRDVVLRTAARRFATDGDGCLLHFVRMCPRIGNNSLKHVPTTTRRSVWSIFGLWTNPGRRSCADGHRRIAPPYSGNRDSPDRRRSFALIWSREERNRSGQEMNATAVRQAPAIGLLRVILNEHPHFVCRAIDLSPSVSASDDVLLWSELLRNDVGARDRLSR